MQQGAVPTWRRVAASLLDLATAFFGFGMLIGWLTGNLKTNGKVGFNLEGAWALVQFALVIAYFVVGRLAGGTIWQRILRTGGR